MTIPNVELNDGNVIPQLGFGVWQVSDEEVVPAVAKALEVGYRHIDTAAIYRNEKGVGQAIADSGVAREDLWVTTKLWNDRHTDARAALEESLEKLGLDYVDLYLIHWPVPGQDKRLEAWEAMERAKADGLVKSIGVSNFLPHFVREVLDAGSTVPAVNQVELHPTFQQRDVQSIDSNHRIVTEAYSPLGTGADLSNGTIGEIAARHGKTPAQVIIRWHLQAGRIVIPKSVTPERIAQNFDVTDFALSATDLEAIDALDSGNRVNANPDEFGPQ